MNLARCLAVAGVLQVAGCAGTTADSCATTDWYRQGYMDGLRSYFSVIDQHAARCAPAGVKPDAARYQKGLEDGHWEVQHRIK